MAEFRKASTDFKSAFEEEMREMERQALQAERKKAAEAAAAAVAAEPSQPATLASPAGTESSLNEVADTRATEAPVISPVAESVPRSSEDAATTNAETAAVTNSQDPPHDTQTPA
jgi:plasmid stability protein